MIFNIDTFVYDSTTYINKNDFLDNTIDGLIYTTNAIGDHWSFAETIDQTNIVKNVSEKIRISDNASIGLYYFKSFYNYCELVNKYSDDIIKNYKEIYIMPLYQYLIDDNKKVIIKNIPIEKFCPLGTPDEVRKFDKNFISKNGGQ